MSRMQLPASLIDVRRQAKFALKSALTNFIPEEGLGFKLKRLNRQNN